MSKMCIQRIVLCLKFSFAGALRHLRSFVRLLGDFRFKKFIEADANGSLFGAEN